MQEIIDLITNPGTLTVTNVILAVCIIVHLICEFAHYIHEFITHRKDGKQVKANGEMLKHMIERIEKIEKSQRERCKNSCAHDEEKEDVANEKMDAPSSSPL